MNDDDLTLFVRMGTDFEDNYYEYEMPLKLTDYGAATSEDIWPEENNVEIVFDDFLNLKKERNELLQLEVHRLHILLNIHSLIQRTLREY